MKNKAKLILIIFGIFLIGIITSVVAIQSLKCEKKIEFYYNPNCPHCQKVIPLVKELSSEFTNWKFYTYDVSQGQGDYKDIAGVPTIMVYPGDGRKIILIGAYEIPKYLKCELQEMSTNECPTHSYLIRNSFFLNE
jgi:thiol-disulfide isomerase/thioredoxin